MWTVAIPDAIVHSAVATVVLIGYGPTGRVVARLLKDNGIEPTIIEMNGEGEVGLAFVEDLLSRLGATAEQIDCERARAHDELFGDRAG